MRGTARVGVHEVLCQAFAQLKEKHSAVSFCFNSKVSVEAYAYDDFHKGGGREYLHYEHAFLTRVPMGRDDGRVLIAYGTTFPNNVGLYEADMVAMPFHGKQEEVEHQVREVQYLLEGATHFRSTLFYADSVDGISHGPKYDFYISRRHFEVRDMLKAKNVSHNGSHEVGFCLYKSDAQYRPESVDALVSIAEEVLSL